MRKALENKLDFVGVDTNEGDWTTYVTDAAKLEDHFLSEFETLLYFGGSSSVLAAEVDPIGALLNNVMVPASLVSKMSPLQRFIYASSASVYSAWDEHNSAFSFTKSNEMSPFNSSLNMYDASKASLDRLMIEAFDTHKTTGLRMGTVSGYNGSARSFRRELVFNSMNISAIENGVVRMNNPSSGRSILFLDDLYLAVESLITAASELPKFLNLYSLNTTIREIASAVSECHNVEIQEGAPSSTYSFQMDSLYSHKFFARSRKSLEERCADFISEWTSE